MKILRVVEDYWPARGGNERWSFIHDGWFTEVAGDDVQVVVLRPQHHLQSPAHGEELRRYSYPSEFAVEGLPRVKAFQELLPPLGTARLIRHFYRRIRPWLTDSVDVVVTQIGHYHAIPSWRAWPVAFEAPLLLSCWYGYRRPDCARSRMNCSRCLRESGPRWWVRDQLRLALYNRYDVIVGDELMAQDLVKVGMESKVHQLKHIVEPEKMCGPLQTPRERAMKATVDGLAGRFRWVLLQLNRLSAFKNPQLLLDLAERVPECAVVFAGDGHLRAGLEARAASSDTLRGRVAFLGDVNAACLGTIAERVSGFVMTSTGSNHNTSLFETMGLGIGPVIAVDTRDFPAAFGSGEHMLRVSANPDDMARAVTGLLQDDERASRMAARGRDYVRQHHSPAQMWRYRERLLELSDAYRWRRNRAGRSYASRDIKSPGTSG